VKICSRGHVTHRDVQFCSQCGSGEFSTPAPRATWLFHVSGFAVYLVAALSLIVVGVVGVLGLLSVLNTAAVLIPLAKLGLMLGFLYWATTLLPGPVRKAASKLGKAVGRRGKSGSGRNH
jgi:hypothetical protein